MRILIDMQGAQSESRYRGIGRYSRSLAQALAEHRRTHEIILLFNDKLNGQIDDLYRDLGKVLPRGNLASFSVPGPCAAQQPGTEWRAQAGALLRNNAVEMIDPDVVLVSSMFEGFLDDAVTDAGFSVGGPPTATVLYDLIPLADQAAYLADPAYRKFYLGKVDALKRSELLLPISQSARREAIDLLDWPPDRADVILAGAPGTPAARNGERPIRIEAGSYLLHVGALDARKNPAALIEAFALLPGAIRRGMRIVFAGRLSDLERDRVGMACGRWGVRAEEVVFTGFVSENDLVTLYREALAAVVPSLHEGFGLPALEAMACGGVVLASNATSLPEIVDRDDLLFDPRKPRELATLVETLSSDPALRDEIRNWGLRRASLFTWKTTAARTLDSLERHVRPRQAVASTAAKRRKPRLAFVSPLPGDRSGIATYSAELLPALSRSYDVVCIVADGTTTDGWILRHLAVRDVAWFERHATGFDRILYQMGNSAFHAHMPALMGRFPGVTVLHDVHLGELLEWMSGTGLVSAEAFDRELYLTHGVTGLIRKRDRGIGHVVRTGTMNDAVLRASLAVLVHSEDARGRILETHGPSVASLVHVQPQLHRLPARTDRDLARKRLELRPDEFVVCSFGLVTGNKLVPLIVEAWAEFRRTAPRPCRLIFVGEVDGGCTLPPDAVLTENGITVTGFVDDGTYADHLSACDAAVQLRVNSRGETSRAILDCLAQGLPCIVNAHSSAAEIPCDCVIPLPENPTAADVTASLRDACCDGELAAAVGARARTLIERDHGPEAIAARMGDLIEAAYRASPLAKEGKLLRHVAKLCAQVDQPRSVLDEFAISLAANQPRVGLRRLLCDVSVLAQTGGNTGIQRVVRSILKALLADPPRGWRVDPVVVAGQAIHARRFLAAELDLPTFDVADEGVETKEGDVFLALDWNPDRLPEAGRWLTDFRRRGGRVVSVVYDLLPLQSPEFFPPWMQMFMWTWFKCIARHSDTIACISKTVATDVERYATAVATAGATAAPVRTFELGADFAGPAASDRRSSDMHDVVAAPGPKFVMVGTVEPRKGHAQMLRVFHALWKQGVTLSLVVVGKLGWMSDAVGASIRSSPEHGRRLFWFENASDRLLDDVYAEADALVAASYGEGFGLPIIEAATRNVHVVARDIPIFREVCGRHAFFFPDGDDDAVIAALKLWLDLFDRGQAPSPRGLRRVDWTESARQLVAITLGDGASTHRQGSEREAAC